MKGLRRHIPPVAASGLFRTAAAQFSKSIPLGFVICGITVIKAA
jgi:hypothetical protein